VAALRGKSRRRPSGAPCRCLWHPISHVLLPRSGFVLPNYGFKTFYHQPLAFPRECIGPLVAGEAWRLARSSAAKIRLLFRARFLPIINSTNFTMPSVIGRSSFGVHTTCTPTPSPTQKQWLRHTSDRHPCFAFAHSCLSVKGVNVNATVDNATWNGNNFSGSGSYKGYPFTGSLLCAIKLLCRIRFIVLIQTQPPVSRMVITSPVSAAVTQASRHEFPCD